MLVVGALPFWISLSRIARLRGAMAGANAAVIGILAAAFIHPIDTNHPQRVRYFHSGYLFMVFNSMENTALFIGAVRNCCGRHFYT